jgi:hypothetical protein
VAKPEIVADNETPGPEPEGFWDPVHRQVKEMTEAALTAAVILLDDGD